MNALPEIIDNDKSVISISNESPMKMYELALAHGADIEQLEKMLAFQEKYDSIKAKKAYTQAMTEFKAKPPVITKDKENKQYKSSYTSLGNLVNSALPRMSECGLSHNWDIDQQNQITVTCIVTHNMGHSESVKMTAPPDGSGSKNPIQQIKSTITYLKAATFESIMGLASTDANYDDDGNAADNRPPVRFINEKQVSQIVDMINETGVDEGVFLEWIKAVSVETIPENSFRKAITALEGKLKK